MEFLSQTAMAFVDMDEEEDIYRFIAEQIHSLVPGSIVGVNAFDPVGQTFTLRSETGDPDDIRAFNEGLGRSMIGAVFPLNTQPQAADSFSLRTLTEGPRLYDFFFHIIPEERCAAVEESMGRGSNYTMGLCCRGGIFGAVGINIKKGTYLRDRETIEAFIHQASVALLRRHARKELRASEETRLKNMEFLSRMAWEFVQLSGDADIYEAIGKGLLELAPDALATINIFDTDKQLIITKAVFPAPDHELCKKYFGAELVGLQYPIDAIAPKILISSKLVKVEADLYQIMMNKFPEEVCRQVTEELNFSDYYTIGLVSQGILFGNLTLFMKCGARLENTDLIETYVRQASIALQRRIAEDSLKKQEREAVRNMTFLSRTAMAFIDMGDDEDIYRFITDQIHGFCPDLVVGANSFDMANGTATLRSISGFDHGTAEKFSEWGVNPLGMTFPLENDMTAENIVSRKCLTPGPARLYDLFFRMVPEKVCLGIEDLINWGGCYAMGVVCRGEIFGSIVLIVQKGKTLENKETIEAFISQAGFALHHRRTLESVSAPARESAERMK